MSTFKTPKGTTLPILNLRGKDYLQVQHRIVWFTEERPTWSIITVIVSITDKSCLVRAEIIDEKHQIRSTAHKMETLEGFGDFIEKAETGAIGRALALVGFGTQFCADELDEGPRLADSPAPHVHPPVPAKAALPAKPQGPVVAPRIPAQVEVNLNAEKNRQVVMLAAQKHNWLPESVSEYINASYGVSFVRDLTQEQVQHVIATIQTQSHTEAMSRHQETMAWARDEKAFIK